MNFFDLEIWKKSHHLSIEVYKITSKFPNSEIFGITSQIRRASTSIGANIAEGFGRKGNKEFCQFLYQAKGSLYEVQNFIFIARDVKYLNSQSASLMFSEYEILAKMLNAFITKVK